MNKNLYIICEGRTETYFVKNILAEHFSRYNLGVIPTTLPTSVANGTSHKGGWTQRHGYQHALKGIRNTILANNYGFHTTIFDFYGFPPDIPCYKRATMIESPYEKAKLFEQQIKQDVDDLFSDDGSYNANLFIPYIQIYEFEAFLFVDAKKSAEILAFGEQKRVTEIESKILNIRNSFNSPEHINNNPETAPSKRLEKIIPGFKKNKAGKAGFSWRVPQNIGIEKLRAECLHFNEWLSAMELIISF